MIIRDFLGRRLKLLYRIAIKPEGSRYVTRKSVANVILGKSTKVVGGSAAANPKRTWPTHCTKTRMKIGCHVFTRSDFKILRNWALKLPQSAPK